MVHEIPEMGMSEMSDASNVRDGGMGRRVSEVRDLLLQMAIVPSSSQTDFVGKLVKGAGWPVERAERAYDEYLRFLLMAWISPEMVVPSHDVDQAWHLHLTHSRHYWDVLCGTILQRPFHHDPSLGGSHEDERHGDAYRRTLALYEHVFGEAAPEDTWPRGCTCGSARKVDATRSSRTEVVMASNPFLPIAVFGIVAGMMAMGMGYAGTAAFIVIITIAMAVLAGFARSHDEREAKARPMSPMRFETPTSVAVASRTERHIPPASRKPANSRGGDSRKSKRETDRSTGMDSSGAEISTLFMSTYTPDAGASHSTHSSGSTHSGSCSTSSHSTQSCSSSSSHSCSSSSCGGSSCGGGGCGGS